jgi:phosphoglycolate phosphatase (TIGR01487 family)
MAINSGKVLVVSDYDRTLAHEKDGFFVSEEVKRRIQSFVERNYFAIVSGREKRLIDIFAKGLKPTAWVLENGTLIFVGDEEILNVPRSWFQIREEVTSRLEKMGINFSVGRVIVYVNNRGFTDQELSQLREICDVEYNRGDAMILPKGINKASGIAKLKEILKFNGKTIGVGDGENDLKMMEVVDVKVAVGNAVPMIKEVADLVLKHEDGEGILELLDLIDSGKLTKKTN